MLKEVPMPAGSSKVPFRVSRCNCRDEVWRCVSTWQRTSGGKYVASMALESTLISSHPRSYVHSGLGGFGTPSSPRYDLPASLMTAVQLQSDLLSVAWWTVVRVGTGRFFTSLLRDWRKFWEWSLEVGWKLATLREGQALKQGSVLSPNANYSSFRQVQPSSCELWVCTCCCGPVKSWFLHGHCISALSDDEGVVKRAWYWSQFQCVRDLHSVGLHTRNELED